MEPELHMVSSSACPQGLLHLRDLHAAARRVRRRSAAQALRRSAAEEDAGHVGRPCGDMATFQGIFSGSPKRGDNLSVVRK